MCDPSLPDYSEVTAGNRAPRPPSVAESIKHGVSELRALGRRMSASIRGKDGKTRPDTSSTFGLALTVEAQQVIAQTAPSSPQRPKSRGFLRRRSTRRRSSVPVLNVSTGHLLPEYSVIEPVPGSWNRPPRLPDDLRSGAGARAAAAAQNEILHSRRSAHLANADDAQPRSPGVKLPRDSESGIGIGVDLDYRRQASAASAYNVTGIDPSKTLAAELMIHIFRFLDPVSLLNAELVSRRWQHLVSAPSLWRDMFYREYASRSLLAPRLVRPKIPLAAGIGKGLAQQDWRKLYRSRHLLDRRWRDGQAAAIYLNGHKDSVYCVQFDEQKIVTGSRDNTVRIWDAHTYQCIRKLGPPNNRRERYQQARRDEIRPQGAQPLCTLEVSSQDPVGDRALSMWHDASILCLQYDDEILVTGSSDFSCLVWSIRDDYTPRFRLVGHASGVLDVCLDTTRIVTCSKDATIKVWDRATGALIRTLVGHRGPVNAIQIRGNLLVSASGDGGAKLWRLDDGVCFKEFLSRDWGLACVELSDDGRTIFAGGNHQVIYEYDTLTGTKIRELADHTNLVRSLNLDSTNGRLISGSYDQTIKVWPSHRWSTTHADDREPIARFEGWMSSWVLAAKSDYRRIVCTGQDGRVLIIDFGYGIEGVETLES